MTEITHIPDGADIVVALIIEALYEESYEIIDHSVITRKDGDETDYDQLLDEAYLGDIMEIDPKTKILVTVEPGIYEYIMAVVVESETFILIRKRKLNEEEANNCYTSVNFPDADLGDD